MEYIYFEGTSGTKWKMKKNPGLNFEDYVISNRPLLKDETLNISKLIEKSISIFGMENAITYFLSCIKNKETIGIIVDYDVDGTTSCAVLKAVLEFLGIEYKYIIPNRFSDGYGPSILIFKKFAELNIKNVFIIDCGSTAHKEIEYASSIGINTIIIDHHSIDKINMPNAKVIINPQINNHEYSILCSVGLTFCFLWNLIIELQKQNINISHNIILKYTDLVALGTVCDVVPLVSINRTLVKMGLKVANMEGSSLQTFFESDQKSYTEINENFLGFQIGPKINSAGRFGFSELAIKAFDKDPVALESLKTLNESRKSVEKLITARIMEFIQTKTNIWEKDDLMIIWGDASDYFFAPVLGIIAGKIKTMMKKSVFLISLINDLGKGSARSLNNLHTGKAMAKATEKGIIISGGGHLNAGGFSIKKENLTEFCEFLYEQRAPDKEQSYHTIDACLSLEAVNEDLIKTLKKIGPFGQENPTLIFFFPNVKILKYTVSIFESFLCTISNSTESKRINGFCNQNEKTKKFIPEILNKNVQLIASIQEYKNTIRLNIIDCVEEKE